MTKLAPACASPRAIASPMPRLPPVTIATLPARSNSFMATPRVTKPDPDYCNLCLPACTLTLCAGRGTFEVRGRIDSWSGTMPMPLRTRLTERFGLEQPILSAPMAFVAGGALAAAVSRAGGLGLIGGGYGDGDWLNAQFGAAGNQVVGCGFITWSLASQPHLLAQALDRRPRAIMLSFGDPVPFAEEVRAAGASLICQIQTLAHARRAIEAGADVIVAQGAEAGGHGAVRGTLTLVPEVLDLCVRCGADALVLAAGGIADGRGLAAALMLGADGVLVGTCLYAAREALVPPALQRAVVAADGDATVRTSVVDTIRSRDWPPEFSIRVQRNAMVDRWHGREDELKARLADAAARYTAAASAGDPDESAVIVGEAVGLIDQVRPAADIIQAMAAGAEAQLRGSQRLIVAG
ncbi:MAG: NAD(P)H-dependent flavin oxidoreductase [Geminicoccaceae bacterium]